MAKEEVEAPQVQKIYVVAPNNLKEAYTAKPALTLGIVQISCAVLTLILGVTAGIGMFIELCCTVIFLLSGVITLAGARTGTKCLIITTMVLCIISTICGSFLAFWAVHWLHNETEDCKEITEHFGDMERDTPYFVNINKNYTNYEDYDSSLCDQTRTETGVEYGMLNGTFIGSSHPCFVLICSNLKLASHSLLLLCSLVMVMANLVTAGLTCRATCCYTPPHGAQAALVYNKSESDEGEVNLVGKYNAMKSSEQEDC